MPSPATSPSSVSARSRPAICSTRSPLIVFRAKRNLSGAAWAARFFRFSRISSGETETRWSKYLYVENTAPSRASRCLVPAVSRCWSAAMSLCSQMLVRGLPWAAVNRNGAWHP